ncbi:MAG: SelB C-terminal domain-containing protein, partial [Chloroflexota bacterium]
GSRDTVLLPASLWAKVAERARDALQEYHRRYPLRRGAPREDVRTRLHLNEAASTLVLQRLIREGVVLEEEAFLRLPEHKVVISPAQRQALESYVKLLGSEPYSPPTAEPPEPDLLQLLVEEGKVVRVSDSVVFTAEAYQQMVDRIVQHLKSEGKITVGQVRDMFNTSRKYTLALMEHMDQRHITRRVGDERVLR